MQWDHRQRPFLPAGMILCFRNLGLKKNPDFNPPRHDMIEEKLGQGRLCVYKVHPVMLPEIELPEVDAGTEK